jgi:diguanylate cyclase (GGDEF)-like protein
MPMVKIMKPFVKPRSALSRGAVMLAVALGWIVVMLALAELLATSQAHARRDVAQKLGARAAAGAEFSSLYVKDILAREREQAASWLTVRRPTRLSLAHASEALGFSAALLVDRGGRVLQTAPAQPDFMGVTITGLDPYLAPALAGKAAVSNVVQSATGLPVVATAVPFATASGRRVLSGSFDVSKSPLGGYMRHVIVVPGHRVYMVDATGNLIASSGPPLSAGETLSQPESRLARLVRVERTGAYSSPHGGQFFVSAAIAGTPWRIVVVVPEAQLYIPVDGASKWLAWGALAALAVAGLLINMMGLRLVHSRRRLATLNAELERVARVDVLTGLSNRRAIEETLIAALSTARRHQSSLSILLIDIDHFKRVNDTRGHQAGDAVLTSTGRALEMALRTEDAVGRWGGEEFLAVLPNTDAEGALVIAERLRAHAARPRPGSADPRDAITVTIGAAAWESGGMDDLISRADHALYAGKAAGRNNVQLSAANAADTPIAPKHARA